MSHIIKYNSKHVLSVVILEDRLHLVTATELDDMPEEAQREFLNHIVALYLKNMQTNDPHEKEKLD